MRSLGTLWEVAVSVAAALALALATTVLLPAAEAVYQPGGPVFTVVAGLTSRTPASDTVVVALLTGSVGGLFTLYVLDEARRLVALPVAVAVGAFTIPELRRLGRIVDSVVAAPVAFAVALIGTTVVTGVASLGIFPGESYENRDTLAYLRRGNFRTAVRVLYALVLGGISLIVVRSLAVPVGPSPLRVFSAGVVALGATTVLFRYHSETGVVIVGVGGRGPAERVSEGLERSATRRHEGFPLSDYGAGPEEGFGYRAGTVLRRTVVVSVANRLLRRREGGSIDVNRPRLRLRGAVAAVTSRWLPGWAKRSLPVVDDGTVETADTVVFAVAFPDVEVSDRRYCGLLGDETGPLSSWVGVYDQVPGTDVIVVATGARGATGVGPDDRLGDSVQSAKAAERLGVETSRTVAVDAGDHDGGYDELFGRL